MIEFEKVSRFADVDLPLPVRGTSDSAGYDFVVAEDTVVYPMEFYIDKIRDKGFENHPTKDYYGFVNPMTLDDMAAITKELKAKPTLVSTGMKCHLDPGTYLELSVRSSTPLKYWLVLANSIGVIDRDYCDNPGNEGEIFFQLINLSPFAIKLQRGEKIGQGIVKPYLTTDSDAASGKRIGGFGSTTLESPSA